MALTREELVRRVVAARELRGLTQLELGQLVADEGLGKHDMPKLERGENGARFTGAHRRVLASVLRVPERWFTDDDDRLFAGLVIDPDRITALEDALAATQDRLGPQVERLESRVLELEAQAGRSSPRTGGRARSRRPRDA